MTLCKISISWTIGCLLLAMLFAMPAFAARTALVIGNAAYPGISDDSLFGVLDNPVNDAQAIGRALETYGFDVIVVTDADQPKMEGALKLFLRQLERGGAGVFYFSGHGVQVEDDNYLIPVGRRFQDAQDVRQYALNAQLVLQKMSAAGPQVNIMILDACREHMPVIAAKAASARGLARMQGAVGAIIAYATDPGNVAYDIFDDVTQRNSLYTQYLLEAMQQGEWPIELVFKQAQIEVARVTERQQVPWVESGLVSQFCFAACGGFDSFGESAQHLRAADVPAVRRPDPDTMRLEVERRMLASLQRYQQIKQGKTQAPMQSIVSLLTRIIDDMYIYEVYYLQVNPETAEKIRAMRMQYEAELRQYERNP